MSDSSATFERRLDALERTVADPRRRIPGGSTDPGAMSAVDRLICRTDPETLRAIAERVRREMGIEGEPIGAEELQRQMLERGADPTGNEFSRAIIEMREE